MKHLSQVISVSKFYHKTSQTTGPATNCTLDLRASWTDQSLLHRTGLQRSGRSCYPTNRHSSPILPIFSQFSNKSYIELCSGLVLCCHPYDEVAIKLETTLLCDKGIAGDKLHPLYATHTRAVAKILLTVPKPIVNLLVAEVLLGSEHQMFQWNKIQVHFLPSSWRKFKFSFQRNASVRQLSNDAELLESPLFKYLSFKWLELATWEATECRACSCACART